MKRRPDRFGGVGLLVGHRLHPPADPENPGQLEQLVTGGGLAGLRLSPIYDLDVAWLNDPVSHPLWSKAQDLGAVFNIFAMPHQVGQIGDMARRFPGVKVVIDPFAMFDIAAPDPDGFGPLLELRRLPNVHIRTSLHNPSRERLLY